MVVDSVASNRLYCMRVDPALLVKRRLMSLSPVVVSSDQRNFLQDLRDFGVSTGSLFVDLKILVERRVKTPASVLLGTILEDLILSSCKMPL